MSTALLKKSLSLCESDNFNKLKHKSGKLKARVTKLSKEKAIQSNKKVSVAEARKRLKAQGEILEENLRMIKEAKKACKVKLSEDITDEIVERALPRKNRKNKEVTETKEETVFTEEDFKKFEEEYIVE